MRGSLRWPRAVLAGCALLMLSGGCGDPFAPPTRARSTSRPAGPEISRPKYLVYVVPGVPNLDTEVWGVRAQHEANDKRAIFRIMGPGPSDTPAKQPEVVRKALADGASALIVYPGDAPDLPKVLAEAEAKGVPVVLIDKGLATPEGSKPFTVVEPAPFEDTARQIVAAAREDLKKARQPLDGTALILVDKLVDTTSGRRAAALRAAAEAAGFRKVVRVDVDGANPDAAKDAVEAAVKANPDVSVALAEDGEGMVAGAKIRAQVLGKPVFFVGGYVDYRSSPVVQAPAQESCHVEGRFAELGALAVLTALSRIRGEAVAEHVYVTPKFVKTAGLVSSPDAPNSSFPTLIRNSNSLPPVKEEPAEKPKEPARP